MKKQTYETIGKLFPIFVGISVIMGIILDNSILPLIVVGIGVPLIIWSKSRVEEVIEDERDQEIGGKAMRNAVVVFAIIATIIGLILYAQGGDVKMAVSHTLLGSVSFILVSYIAFFAYLERKM
jgi:uncharacterized membrane protein